MPVFVIVFTTTQSLILIPNLVHYLALTLALALTITYCIHGYIALCPAVDVVDELYSRTGTRASDSDIVHYRYHYP